MINIKNIFLILAFGLFIFFIYKYLGNFDENNNHPPVDLSSLIKKTKSEERTGHKIQIEIQNGCGLKGIAKLYTNFLRNKGYDVISFKNASNFNFNKTLLIVHKKDTSNFVDEIINILQINPNSVSYKYNDKIIYEMTVIVGKDYEDLDSFDEVSEHYGPF